MLANKRNSPKPSLNPASSLAGVSKSKTMSWRRSGGEALLRLDPAFPRSPAWRRVTSASHHRTIQAVPREAAGGRSAAKERAQGRVPSVVVSLSGSATSPKEAPKQLISTDAKQIKEILKQSPYFCSTPIKLQVRAGARSSAVLQSGTVLPIKVGIVQLVRLQYSNVSHICWHIMEILDIAFYLRSI